MKFNTTSSLWTTVIPGQLSNTTVEFYVLACDNAANTNTSSTYSFNVKSLITGDIDGDGDVDIYDIVAAASNYGQSWQP